MFGLVLVALAGVAALAGLLVLQLRAGHDVRGSSTVEFVTSVAAPRLRPTPVPLPRAAVKKTPAPRVEWGTYGFDAVRSRVAATGAAIELRPPFRRLWTFHGRALLEFPPAVAYGLVYQLTFDGRLYALDAATGRTRWHRRSDRCGWASPAVDGGMVFVALIGRNCDSQVPGADGVVVALDARTGELRWRRRIGPVESSPLVAGGSVFVGDWEGGIYSLAERTGRVRWRFQATDKVKGSVALSAGRVFIGDYGGNLYALDARSGRLIWQASAQSRLFRSTGAFYSTPALAYGRVYLGSTDGKVYSFGATSGKLRWSQSTGGYVYASPAVWRRRILIGSYDHRFYALDAATGDTVWRFDADGPISGSATVVDGLVYFSTLAETTYALDATTGRLVWRFADGKYSPVVVDRERLYLVGLGRLYGLAPRR
jgi:outer membrane protein assembly factor BamB